MDSPASDPSEMTVLKALKSTTRFPFDQISTTTASENSSSESDDHHSTLLQTVRDASEAYEAVCRERDLHDLEADPVKASKLHRKIYEAELRLLHAERDYYLSQDEIMQDFALPQPRHTEFKASEFLETHEESIQSQETLNCKAHTEEIETLRRQAQLDQDIIHILRHQLQVNKLNTARSTLAQRREITELTGFNSHLSWEAAQLTSRIREMEGLSEKLEYQEEELEEDRFLFNPNWEDPKPKDAAGVIAVRGLAKRLALTFGGKEEFLQVDEEPMKNVKGEVNRLYELLEKHGVVTNALAKSRSESRASQNTGLLQD